MVAYYPYLALCVMKLFGRMNDIVGDTFIHRRCRMAYITRTYGLSEKQFNKLYGISELKEFVKIFEKGTKETIAQIKKDIKKLEECQNAEKT